MTKDYSKLEDKTIDYCEAEEIISRKVEEKLKNRYSSSCKHDLVLHFGKEGINTEDTGYSVCLCCGKKFHLNQMDYGIKDFQIINIVGLVSDKYLYIYQDSVNLLAIVARKKLELIALNDSCIHIENIKHMLIEELIDYTEELEVKNENPSFISSGTEKLSKTILAVATECAEKLSRVRKPDQK